MVQDKLVLFTNRKLHPGFRLLPELVTLNRPVAIITHSFTQCDSFRGQLRQNSLKLNPYCPRQKYSLGNLVLSNTWCMGMSHAVSAVAELIVT